MTAPLPATGSGLPIDTALEPASVRNGSPATQKAYAGALEFERMLVQQLSQSLTESSGLGGEGLAGQGGGESDGGGGDPVSTQLSSLLPQTLADGVMSQGGLGLAAQLMGSLDPSAARGVGPGAPNTAVTPAGGSPAGAPAIASAQIDSSGGVPA